MHHVHMSTGFMLVLAVFFVGTLGLILWYRRSTQRDRLDAQRPVYHTVYDPLTDTTTTSAGERPASTHVSTSEPWYRRSSYTAPAAPAPSYQSAPAPAYAPAPAQVSHNPMGGFATGLILGDLLGHAHSGGGSHGGSSTTIINEAPSHSSSSDSSSSWLSSSSSSSSDSGFSWSDNSSSSSSYSDSSSSGGFDASW